MAQASTSRLMYISSWKLNSESSREEPRLRKLLGHLSVYENTRISMRDDKDCLEADGSSSELAAYLHYQAPSFKEFQAAIQDQLATMAKVTAASAQLAALRYNLADSEDDSDSDSDSDTYDGEDWTDEETAAESDESFTDNESTEGQWSECTSPTEAFGEEEEDPELWAVRPLALPVRTKSNELR